MKKLLIIGLAVIVSSCAVTGYNESRYMLDFRPYADGGFKIYSAPFINEPYDCLADLTLEVTPGSSKEKVSGIAINGQPGVFTQRVSYKISTNDMLKKFVQYAKDAGANGIINLKMSIRPENGVRIYVLSGSAIKIKSEK